MPKDETYDPRPYDWEQLVAAVKGILYATPTKSISITSATRRNAVLWADEEIQRLRTLVEK